MPTSWTQNYYHAVFSTKHRAPRITPDIETRLYPFIGGVLRDLRASALAIGGMPDHVHLLARYPSDLSHADLVRHVKSRSSKWLHETFPTLRDLYWQEGYGGFTVSESRVEDVRQYIEHQKEHHAARSFVDEVREFCRLHGIHATDEELFG